MGSIMVIVVILVLISSPIERYLPPDSFVLLGGVPVPHGCHKCPVSFLVCCGLDFFLVLLSARPMLEAGAVGMGGTQDPGVCGSAVLPQNWLALGALRLAPSPKGSSEAQGSDQFCFPS